jgi:tryptophan-rich sensory protein
MRSQKYSMILKFCPRPKLAKFDSFLLLAIAIVATSQNKKKSKTSSSYLAFSFGEKFHHLMKKEMGC